MNRPIQPTGDLPALGYLTRAAVLARYHISNSTLHAWIAAGKFPKQVRIGPRAVRFLASDLAAYEAAILAARDAERA
jgi:predicted DNA-binding transcriptional regulator AlpA